MARTSQCFRAQFFQPDGPPTLAAAELHPYALSPPSSFFLRDTAVFPFKIWLEQKRLFSVSSFTFVGVKAWRVIWRALEARRVPRRCVLLWRLRSKELPFEATRESRFRPHAPEKKSTAPS